MQTEKDPDYIKIVGYGEKSFPFKELKSTVVFLSGKWYRKDSEEVVRIEDDKGKKRYFRKNSALIVQIETGEYVHKSKAILTEDGIYLIPNSENVVEINGKFYRRNYCVKINDKWYLITDPTIVKTLHTGYYGLKKDFFELDTTFYKPNSFELPKHCVKTVDNTSILKEHSHEYIDGETGDLCIIHRNVSAKTVYGPSNIVYEFQDKTNPQEDRLVMKRCKEEDIKHFVPLSFHPEGSTYLVHKSRIDYFTQQINDYIVPRLTEQSDKLRTAINKNFSDLDEKENQAKIFKNIVRPWPGKYNIYTPKQFSTPVKSSKFESTGRLEYSFGIEFETSQGVLSPEVQDQVRLCAVGDRSIGAAEYVTPPMMGDSGVEMLKLMCEALNKKTLVDDRCGLHVHVGSLFTPTLKQSEPKAVQSPSFSKEYFINIIRLCCYIEEELFMAMPKSRKPTLYHCHSIRRFEGINKTNYASFLGAFIFGQKEHWVDENGNELPQWDFDDYKLSANRNANGNVGQWADGRYKWLNLIPSFFNNKVKTTEFRIFSPTTVFDKTYAYLLTSLALVYVADNCGSIIKKGMVLSDVFKAAYPKHKDIQDFLNDFYQQRIDKFSRKNLYPKVSFLK